MKRIATILLLGALALSPGLSLAQKHGHPEEGGHALEQLVVEMVHTPQQHAALARYYRARAAEARAEMRRHESVGRAYGGGKFTQRQRMKRHCENLSERYAGMVDEYDALAKLHEEEAKGTQ